MFDLHPCTDCHGLPHIFLGSASADQTNMVVKIINVIEHLMSKES